MIFKYENHDPLVQPLFTQLIQANKINRTPLLYFKDPWCLPFQLIKKIELVEKKLSAHWKWFPNMKTMTLSYKHTLCN